MTPANSDAGRDSTSLRTRMDELSLQQALIDFEVANARVLDLAQRLVEAQATVTELRTQLETLRIEYAQLQSQHERMKESRAFKSASKIWALRNALGI